MRTYLIGDLQGCFASLQALLAELAVDLKTDRLWFCGDLIGRGPDPLGCLDFLYDHQDVVVATLGNHDLATLKRWHEGQITKAQTPDLYPLLSSNRLTELMTWLRFQPLLHHDEHYNITLVHAGLWPHWSLLEARQHANEVEQALRSSSFGDLMTHLYGDEDLGTLARYDHWQRLRFLINVFTRMRFCREDGTLLLQNKGGIFDVPPGAYPWYALPDRVLDTTVVFGHWAALNGASNCSTAIALDTGCVWGRRLTAYCLETAALTSVPAHPSDLRGLN